MKNGVKVTLVLPNGTAESEHDLSVIAPTEETMELKIGNRLIGPGHPTYFIADIGANFDGNLDKAKELALAVKQAGGDVVKIQSFLAPKIVSGNRCLQRANFNECETACLIA